MSISSSSLSNCLYFSYSSREIVTVSPLVSSVAAFAICFPIRAVSVVQPLSIAQHRTRDSTSASFFFMGKILLIVYFRGALSPLTFFNSIRILKVMASSKERKSSPVCRCTLSSRYTSVLR